MAFIAPNSRLTAKPNRFNLPVCTVFCLLVFLPSCASQETYLEKGRLAGLNRMLLSVSSEKLEVDYAWNTWSGACAIAGATLNPLLDLICLIGAPIALAKDHQLAEGARSTLLKESLGQIMREAFREEYAKKPECQLVDLPSGADPKEYTLQNSTGAQARIAITLVELSLRGGVNRIELGVEVQGELMDLTSGQIIWSRREIAVGQESFTIESWTANQGELIWAMSEQMVRKATRRLAYDLVYSP